jgi:hypothetical protein
VTALSSPESQVCALRMANTRPARVCDKLLMVIPDPSSLFDWIVEGFRPSIRLLPASLYVQEGPLVLRVRSFPRACAYQDNDASST